MAVMMIEAYKGLNVFKAFCNKKRGKAIEVNASVNNSTSSIGLTKSCVGFEMINANKEMINKP